MLLKKALEQKYYTNASTLFDKIVDYLKTKYNTDILGKDKDKLEKLEDKLINHFYLEKVFGNQIYAIMKNFQKLTYPKPKLTNYEKTLLKNILEAFRFFQLDIDLDNDLYEPLRVIGLYLVYGSSESKFKLENMKKYIKSCASKYIHSGYLNSKGNTLYAIGYVYNIFNNRAIGLESVEDYLYVIKQNFMGFVPTYDYLKHFEGKNLIAHRKYSGSTWITLDEKILKCHEIITCGMKLKNPPISPAELKAFNNISNNEISLKQLKNEIETVKDSILHEIKTPALKTKIQQIFSKEKSPILAYETMGGYVQNRIAAIRDKLKNVDVDQKEFNELRQELKDLKKLGKYLEKRNVVSIKKTVKDLRQKIYSKMKQKFIKDIPKIAIAVVCYIIIYKLAKSIGYNSSLMNIVKLFKFIKNNWRKLSFGQKIWLVIAVIGFVVPASMTLYDFVSLLVKLF